MKKITLILFLICIFLVGCSQNDKLVCIKDKCLTVEIADSKELQMVGLMNRDHLDADKGMLFVFKENTIHTFWMKNTLIPLDMIWRDENKEVVHIEENALPCKSEPCQTYNHEVKARYVLETNSGFVKENNIKEKNKFKFIGFVS